MMKKAIILFVIVAVFLCGCTNKHNYDILEQIDEEYTRLYSVNSLRVYTNGNDYLVTISEGETVYKYVVFSKERECQECVGVELIDNCDINKFLDIDFDEIEKGFGPHHVNIGSGFYIYSYITKDAYLIGLYPDMQTGKISQIIKWDLFTDETVDKARGNQ